ncbi:DUF3307 domain-containing protein [Psychrobacillus sp. NPDC096389]|uniref:DUF3307 domain-containing protein n=1 Tax=Psychrobacillus sp. NPDC096389 TaxID=3364490 RepID=UPI003827932C
MGAYTLLLVLGQLLADFSFQMKWIFLKNNESRKHGIRGSLKQSGVQLGIYIVLTFIFFLIVNMQVDYVQIAIVIIIITCIHFFIDLAAKWLDELYNKKYSSEYMKSLMRLLIFLAVQIFHMATIILIIRIVTNTDMNFIKNLIALITLDERLYLTQESMIILSGIILLINTYFSGFIISIILQPFRPSNSYTESREEKKVTITKDNKIKNQVSSNESVQIETQSIDAVIQIQDSPKNAGIIIGIVERLIIMVLVMVNAIGSIGFIIAMKAITRFKQFEDKSFAEYYLIGSLISILFGIVSGYLMLSIWN